MNAVFASMAYTSAFVGAFMAALTLVRAQQQSRRQRALRQKWQGQSLAVRPHVLGLADVLLDSVSRFSVARQQPNAALLGSGQPRANKRLAQQLLHAGMGDVSVSSAQAWRMQAALIACACAGLVGLFVGPLFACVSLLVGFLLGWASLAWALSKRIAQRSFALERHLSEAIEVMCLGLRAGLSFERSLELYCENFPSQLSTELANAQHMWHTGLLSREDALRTLAASYNSQLFERVIDSMVRSLRFGSPLANSLEDLAHEARRAHRVQVEEKVMKAPVKMMLPIGLLILPSMLLLVMGPIMLELITDF